MKFEHGRALIVGVANYEEVQSLSDALLNDARDTADVLKSPSHCGYPEENVIVLTDKEATLAGLRKALANLAAIATADDTVVIFFSGHGARLGKGSDASRALVPYDCKCANLAGTVLVEAALSLAIAAIKAPRGIVIIDACHAGGTASLKADQETTSTKASTRNRCRTSPAELAASCSHPREPQRHPSS